MLTLTSQTVKTQPTLAFFTVASHPKGVLRTIANQLNGVMRSGLSAVIDGFKPTLSAPVLFFLVVIVVFNSLFVVLMSIDSSEATNGWVLKFRVRM